EAEPGATGVELLLSIAVKWSREHNVPLNRALAAITTSPVAVLGSALGEQQSQLGQLSVGGIADLCIVNPDAEWTVEPKALASQGKSTPFTGYELPARVTWTIVDGEVAYQR
ncbi:MAG: dihydroorotase, partial [Comamonas sp.]